ncbi:hypothetical protein [Candidatus Palauibacter sp.]|uniref:hypothetical protein n=1 Tax=Candidatus Palauibacter sp. TaxID=3101350 RepID=UPI003CC5F706
MKPRAATCLLFSALAACQVDSAPVSEVSARDSMGIRIVEYGAVPELATPFVFSSQPLYRYGAGAEDYAFQRIWRGVLLPDGGAAVADGFNREIVLIGPDGEFGGLLAGPGDGPGELDLVRELFSLGGDTLLVEDFGHARFTIFVGDAVVREVDTRFLNRNLRALGLDSAGHLLMTSSSYRPGFPEPWLQGHMARFDMDAGVVDTVAAYDWVPSSPREDPINPFMQGGMITASGGRFVYLRSDTPEVMWRNLDGTLHQIVRWDAERVYPTEEHWALYESAYRVMLRPANPQIQSEAEFEEFMREALARYERVPDEPLPLFSVLFGDREGRVWMGHHAPDAQLNGVTRYSVLAPDGRWLGTVWAPPRTRILDVAEGRVLGAFRDELGVESLVLYELLPPGAVGGG